MLFARLDAEGTLIIQADEPIEAYALKQWERQRAAGKAALKIETGRRVDISALTASVGKDIVAFRKWHAQCALSAVVSDEDAAVIFPAAKLASQDQPR